jgi:hypothetical protein
MLYDVFQNTLSYIGSILSILLIPMATIIVGLRVLNEKKETGKLNVIRTLIFGIFLNFSLVVIFEFITESTPFSTEKLLEMVTDESNHFTINNFLTGLVVTLGIAMVCYANGWEAFYYTSTFLYGGMFIFYLLTGFDGWLVAYIYAAGAFSIIFLYLTGIKFKDNGSLGLAIFFTFVFITVGFNETLIGEFFVMMYLGFILYFSFGFFKPYSEEVLS